MEKKRNILHEIHSFMSDNDKYDRLQDSEKLDIVDSFYNDAFYDEQFKLLTITTSENRTENSNLLEDIYKDDRFKKLDMLEVNPRYQNSYISFETIAKKIFNVLEKTSEENLNHENIEKALLPITTIIEIGGVDTQYQKNMLGIGLRNLEMYVATSENINNKNEVNNIITTIIDDTSYWREEEIFKKEKDIISRIINDKAYSDQFPAETLKTLKETVLSYQSDEIKKIAEIVKDKNDPENLFTKMLIGNERFSSMVNEEKKKAPRMRMS